MKRIASTKDSTSLTIYYNAAGSDENIIFEGHYFTKLKSELEELGYGVFCNTQYDPWYVTISW
ncbi:hypothetical protein D3C76_1863040 [compost metagenome]